MKRLLVAAVLTSLFAAPLPVAAADLVLRNIDISIGIGDRHHRHERHERRPEVVVIREDRHRGHGHRGRDWREHRRWRHEPQVIVIDRDRHSHRRSCDSRPIVVIADGRRW